MAVSCDGDADADDGWKLCGWYDWYCADAIPTNSVTANMWKKLKNVKKKINLLFIISAYLKGKIKCP